MRLKTFHAASMSEAMRQIRTSLGDDAIIVANKRGRNGGVEVTAAIEADAAPTPAAPLPSSSVDRPPDPAIASELAQALAYHGVPQRLAARLCAAATDLGGRSSDRALTRAFDDAFGFQPLRLATGERPLMLIGPPGVGKTVTVAKLAARTAMAGLPATVITCDTIRAGGVGQLAAITDLLKQPLLTIDQPAALTAAVAAAARRGPVLIDTAGTNPYDDAALAELNRLVTAAGAEPLLVLAAGTDTAEAGETAIAFAGTGITRLLPTRLDVARRYGALLNAAAVAGLRFADASLSASIVKGLSPLSATALARLFLRDPTAAPIDAEFEEATA